MAAVTSESVLQWWPMVEKLAKPHAREAEEMAERSNGLFNSPAGAEFDDLVQVGLEQCWKSMEEGHLPGETSIAYAMKNHLRVVFKQRGNNV